MDQGCEIQGQSDLSYAVGMLVYGHSHGHSHAWPWASLVLTLRLSSSLIHDGCTMAQHPVPPSARLQPIRKGPAQPCHCSACTGGPWKCSAHQGQRWAPGGESLECFQMIKFCSKINLNYTYEIQLYAD